MYREIREKIQLLKIGPLESRKNRHAALKWVIMTKCKIGVFGGKLIGDEMLHFWFDGGPENGFFTLF